MNAIPIVVVSDLADNSFEKTTDVINFKLSKQEGNGLKLNPDGLMYNAAGGGGITFERLLIGSLTVETDDRHISLNADEVTVDLNISDLGVDGKYLNFNINSPHLMRIDIHDHLDYDNFGTEATLYTDSLTERDWTYPSTRVRISYQVAGVNRSIMLSRTELNGTFYVWADVFGADTAN